MKLYNQGSGSVSTQATIGHILNLLDMMRMGRKDSRQKSTGTLATMYLWMLSYGHVKHFIVKMTHMAYRALLGA